MIDQPRPMAERLSPIRCGKCGWPVAHMNKMVPGAEGGGVCLRCEKAFTYYAIIEADCRKPCCTKESSI